MKTRIIHFFDNYKNHTLITPWSFIHFLFGIFFYLFISKFFKNVNVLNSFLLLLIIHTIYEINDHIYIVKFWKHSSNSLLNSVGDTVFSILGFYLAYKYLNKKIFIKFSIVYFFIFLFFYYNMLD